MRIAIAVHTSERTKIIHFVAYSSVKYQIEGSSLRIKPLRPQDASVHHLYL